MSNIGSLIRKHREALGWTQPELSVKSQVAVATISKAERHAGEREGNGTLKLGSVLKMAKALNLTKLEEDELVIEWLRLQLGEEAKRLIIESREDVLKDAPPSLRTSILSRLVDMPTEEQELILWATNTPPAIRTLRELKSFHTASRPTPSPTPQKLSHSSGNSRRRHKS